MLTSKTWCLWEDRRLYKCKHDSNQPSESKVYRNFLKQTIKSTNQHSFIQRNNRCCVRWWNLSVSQLVICKASKQPNNCCFFCIITMNMWTSWVESHAWKSARERESWLVYGLSACNVSVWMMSKNGANAKKSAFLFVIHIVSAHKMSWHIHRTHSNARTHRRIAIHQTTLSVSVRVWVCVHTDEWPQWKCTSTMLNRVYHAQPQALWHT